MVARSIGPCGVTASVDKPEISAANRMASRAGATTPAAVNPSTSTWCKSDAICATVGSNAGARREAVITSRSTIASRCLWSSRGTNSSTTASRCCFAATRSPGAGAVWRARRCPMRSPTSVATATINDSWSVKAWRTDPIFRSASAATFRNVAAARPPVTISRRAASTIRRRRCSVSIRAGTGTV